jgi:hypothetical protein
MCLSCWGPRSFFTTFYTGVRLRRLLRTLSTLEPIPDDHVIEHLDELRVVLESAIQLAREQGCVRHLMVSSMEEHTERLKAFLGGSWGSGRVLRPDPELAKAVGTIENLAKLKPGWNSYRGAPISVVARQKAIWFLRRLRLERPEAPIPIVGPSSDGGVVFQWRDKQREVEIVFLPKANEYSVSNRGSDEYIVEGEAEPEYLAKDIVGKYVLTR